MSLILPPFISITAMWTFGTLLRLSAINQELHGALTPYIYALMSCHFLLTMWETFRLKRR